MVAPYSQSVISNNPKGTVMSLVEKDITSQNVERANTHLEFEKRREREQKLISTDPQSLEHFKASAVPIEQTYVSTPNDEFSLRVRSTYSENGVEYTATLKDRGAVVDGARDRLEINTAISQEAYETIANNPQYPTVRKLRAEPYKGLTIDFFPETEDGALQIIEIEHNDPEWRAQVFEELSVLTGGSLQDVTEGKQADNESLAYQFAGKEQLKSPESLDSFAEKVTAEMIARYVSGKNFVVAGLTGMSGSGKTTVTKGVQDRIVELFGEDFRPIVVSTDDYHFGKMNLEERYGAPWTEWDDPRTYNTQELAIDLAQMSNGSSLLRRHFDFATEEPVFDEEIAPSPFVIVEGLYAGSKDLEGVRDVHLELPTGIATSIGRDVRRLVIEDRANRVFPTPESRLKYQIETALPLYLSRERPGRNSFNACARPLAERAFMLARLHS